MPSKDFCRIRDAEEQRVKLRRNYGGAAKNAASIKRVGAVTEALPQQISCCPVPGLAEQLSWQGSDQLGSVASSYTKPLPGNEMGKSGAHEVTSKRDSQYRQCEDCIKTKAWTSNIASAKLCGKTNVTREPAH